MRSKWYKKDKNDNVWWKHNPSRIGEWVFSFDKKKEYNMFRDYPWKLSDEEKEIFDRENPFWKDFFSDRQVNKND